MQEKPANDHIPTDTEKRSIPAVMAQTAFLVLLFFTFFGTSLPFQPRDTEVDDIRTSNVVNQILYSTLFLLSLFALASKKDSLVALLKKEKFLFLFLTWCVLSTTWSDFTFTATKRLFQIITATSVCLAALLHTRSSLELLRPFKTVLSFYVVLSILAVVLVPEAIDPKHDTWRGLATHKNHLGQASLICILVWFNALRYDESRKRIWSGFMLALSLVLFVGANSMTSFMTLAILALLAALAFADTLFKPLRLGRAVSITVLSGIALLLVLTLLLAPGLLSNLPGYVGRDITFTGRTELWQDMLTQAKGHFLLGSGFASFWVTDNVNLLQLYESHPWLPRQSHNGYLDLLNEVGLVGFLLFAGLLVSYFAHRSAIDCPRFWQWFLVAALIINLMETTLFRPRFLTGTMFIFSYLALFADLTHTYGEDEVRLRAHSS